MSQLLNRYHVNRPLVERGTGEREKRKGLPRQTFGTAVHQILVQAPMGEKTEG